MKPLKKELFSKEMKATAQIDDKYGLTCKAEKNLFKLPGRKKTKII